MSRQYNGGRPNNGNRPTNNDNRNNNNGNNGGDRRNVYNGQNLNIQNVGMIDPSAYGSDSTDIKNRVFTTRDIKNYFQDQASRVDKAISDVLGYEIPKTKVEVMSFSLSTSNEKHPFVPFVMTVTSNILENAETYEELPSVFRPSKDDGVKINKIYYDLLLQKFIYDKEERSFFANGSWRKSMHIQADYKTLTGIRQLLTPKLEYPDNDTENIKDAKIMVLLDPLKVFKVITYDRTHPRERYTTHIKDVSRIDGQNFKYETVRIVNKDKDKYGNNVSMLKDFLARGNTGMA
jgi:hypothetical protein